MRVVEVNRFGGPEVLEFLERPDPSVRRGEVLIEVSACDVLFVDTLIGSGRGTAYFPIRPPYVPGNGVGGTVVAVDAEVDPTWIGQTVVAHTGRPGGGGGYAEFAAVGVDVCARVPQGLGLIEATAVLHDGTTALRLLEKNDVRSGDLVLVLGAAGAMGILLVQLLAARGARVIGAARGQAKIDVVKEAGAQHAIDYGEANWTDLLLEATEGHRPMCVFDGVGGPLGAEAFEMVADGGLFSAHGSPSGSFTVPDAGVAQQRGISVTTIKDLQYGEGDRSRHLVSALDGLATGSLTPVIGQTFPLVDASKAHSAIESRDTVAKTLLLPCRD